MDWTGVPGDVWRLIVSKLDAAADRIRLRADSKYFVSSLPAYQPIWLMLSQDRSGELYDGDAMRRLLLDGDHQEPPPPRRGFILVGEGDHIHQLDLPELHQKRCVSSAGSWIVTADLDGNFSVLNIFTRLQIELPPVSTFMEYRLMHTFSNIDRMNGFLQKVVFSSSDLTNSKDWVAMGLYLTQPKLAIYTPGDASWADFIVDIQLEPQDIMYDCEDLIYFRGRFHIVDVYGEVAVFNMDTRTMNFFSGNHHPKRRLVTRGPPYKRYLVEWMGELLLVKREWFPENTNIPILNRPRPQNTCQFYVFKRDFINHQWVQVNDLGQYCLFLGLNTSVAVSVHDYTGSLKKNCIYFTADRYVDHLESHPMGTPQIADDMGVFSLEDGSIQPLYHGICRPSCSLPMWVIPHLDRSQY